MKAVKLLGVLVVLFAVFSFTSCKDDEKFDTSQLIGKWHITNEDQSYFMDAGIEYTFNSDKSCIIHVINIQSAIDTTISRIYSIDGNGKFLSIYEQEISAYREHYKIIKLTSSEMIWQSTLEDGKYFTSYLTKVKSKE